MPFLAPVIVGWLGVAVLGATAVAVAEIAVGLAISVALSAAANALLPAPEQSVNTSPTTLSTDPDHPRQMLIGEFTTPGSLAYAKTHGPKNTKELRVIALADHPSHSLVKVFVSGEEKVWNSGTGYVDGYNSKLRIRFFDGTQTAAPADLVTNSAGEWLSTDCFINGTWALVEATFDSKLFQGGFPDIIFRIKGMKLYDWRKDSTNGGSGAHRWATQSTWEWSDNAALAAYLILRGYTVNGERIFGGKVSSSVLPIAYWTEAANICDELVTKLDTTTEKRYRVNGVFDCTANPSDALMHVITAMAGKRVDSSGSYYVKAGAADTVVATFTDDDIVSGARTVMNLKRPANQIINAVFAKYRDPAQLFAEVDLPPRISSGDETLDGGRFDARYDLAYVSSQTQGQRIMEIFRRYGRQQATLDIKLSPRFCELEGGDWITYTSARYGWTNKVFEVLNCAVDYDLTATLRLQEVATSVFAWTTLDELVVTVPTDLPGATPPDGIIDGLALAAAILTSPDGSERPGLTLTWTPPGDSAINDLNVEYRRQGVAGSVMSTIIRDPEFGSHTWITGVQGGVTYEARVQVVSTPPRDNPWSAWYVMSGTTTAQIVTLSLTVPPGTIGPTQLSAQAAFELALVTAVDAGLGSVPALKTQLEEEIAALAQAGGDLAFGLQRHREELLAETNASRAEIAVERIVRATEDTALAALVTTVSTTLGDTTATVTQLQASMDGIKAQWGVAIDVNGHVLGLIRLDTNGTSTTFDVVVDNFRVSLPAGESIPEGWETGTEPIPVFAIGLVNGVATIVLRGNFLADGAIAAQHIAVGTLSAISGNVGELTAGIIRGATGKMIIDLDNDRITAVA